MSAANPEYEIELTDEEQTKAKSAQEKSMDAASEKERAAKLRRIQSYLENGKTLLKKNNRDGARKQLEKAVAEDPDSEPGKEAAKLLESLN